jgi:hypothetical protein
LSRTRRAGAGKTSLPSSFAGSAAFAVYVVVFADSFFASRFSSQAPGQGTARRPSAGGTARGNQPRSMMYFEGLFSRPSRPSHDGDAEPWSEGGAKSGKFFTGRRNRSFSRENATFLPVPSIGSDCCIPCSPRDFWARPAPLIKPCPRGERRCNKCGELCGLCKVRGRKAHRRGPRRCCARNNRHAKVRSCSRALSS